jgi:hypothetical protein
VRGGGCFESLYLFELLKALGCRYPLLSSLSYTMAGRNAINLDILKEIDEEV